MMAQYIEIKRANPDCLLFYRMGDFYELFFADAVKAAAALDITLTRRGKHDGADIPMCGVPVHASETYLSRLIRHGFKVAVCGKSALTALANPRFDSDAGRKRLAALYGVASLDGFGSFGRAELAAAGALVDYVEATQQGRLPLLTPPRRMAAGAVMEIDAATRR